MEHLDNIDLALQELFRVSGKYIVISVPNEPLWRFLNFFRFKYMQYFGNTPGHINHWSPRELKLLISKYGKVLEVHKSFPWIILLAEVPNK